MSQETPNIDPSNIDASAYFKDFGHLPTDQQTTLQELAAVASQLNAVTPRGIQNNLRIPLQHFNFFAPYFMGLQSPGPTDPYVKDENQLRSMWQGCSGPLQFDVDVYEDRDQSKFGQVLFTVPAYIDTDALNVNPALQAGNSFDRMRRLMEGERNFPSAAVAHYHAGIHSRVDSVTMDQISDDRRKMKAEMWAKIFLFYNVDITKHPSYSSIQHANPTTAAGLNAQAQLDDFGGFAD